MTSKDDFNKVISDWLNDNEWIFGHPNLFLIKRYWVYENPVIEGEFLFVFEIIDKTHFVDNELDIYSSNMRFSTYGFSNDEVNPNGDVERLSSDLEFFTQGCIKEYEERLIGYKQQGKQISTTNPIEWKDC